MIYELMDEHEKYYTWVLKNTYLHLGKNIVDNIDIQYDEKFIFRAKIPNFIVGNEKQFVNFESDEYKTFISNKIKHFFTNEYEYEIVPACIIWLKLCKLFNSYSLLIMYNRTLDAVKYFPHEICYNNYKYLKDTPENKVLKDENKVFSSCLFDAHESFQLNEFLSVYIRKIFEMKNYKLLNSELDSLDKYDLNLSKYDNLKYLVFRTGLTQWQLSDKKDMMDFTKVLDLNNYPNPNSIRFSIFIAWALCQKKLGININQINYIENTDLNINKLYNYYIYLINDTTGLLANIIKWLDDLDWDSYEETTISNGSDILKLLNTYEVKTIFNSESELYKAYYDYPTNPNIKISDVIDNKYILKNLSSNIETSIYDDLEDIIDNNNDDTNDDTNDNNNDDTNDNIDKTTDNNLINIQKGGLNKIIGIYKLKNNLGKIISTVPICKISNIIQFV
jgi:hypothetical protein